MNHKQSAMMYGACIAHTDAVMHALLCLPNSYAIITIPDRDNHNMNYASDMLRNACDVFTGTVMLADISLTEKNRLYASDKRMRIYITCRVMCSV